MAEETNTENEIGIIQVNSSLLTNIDEFLKNDKNITRIDCPFPYVTSAVSAFENCTNLKSFNGNLNSFNVIEYYVDNESDNVNLNSLQYGNRMFYGCEKLETFTGDLPSLTNGNNMFYYTNISEFTTDLPKLTDGGEMFRECGNLKTFKSNLKSLTTYAYMFVHTKLNTFDGGTINISDTGSRFISNSYLSHSKDTLMTFKGNFPNIKDTSEMFQGYTELYNMTASMDSVTDATNMFGCIRKKDENGNFIRDENGNFIIISQCGNLKQLNCSMNSLQKGNHMLRDCPKLNENNTDLGFFYRTLADGLCMFLGTSFTSIPWNFPILTRSKQMFSRTNISGHLSLDMTTQFPKVSTNNGEWSDPASYMFSYCPITSIDFDVSSLDNGISMFAHCTQLTQCTGAKFQEGGSYQSMFTESKFDYSSAYFIKQKAKESNVKKLHIGIGFQLTEDHDFTKENSLIKFPEDNSGRQWCEGYSYCHCHNTNEAAALEYFNKHGMTYHCQRSSAITHYLAFPSIMFVCNPN